MFAPGAMRQPAITLRRSESSTYWADSLDHRKTTGHGAHPVVVISHRFWQSHFAGDPKRLEDLEDQWLSVHGDWRGAIVVSGTELIVAADYWVPMSMELQVEAGCEWVQWRTSQNAWTFGRRKPGVTRAQAEVESGSHCQPTCADLSQRSFSETEVSIVVAGPYWPRALRGPIARFGVVLVGVAGLGLLLACVNLAGMLLARASDRRREVGIRLALGAGTRTPSAATDDRKPAARRERRACSDWAWRSRRAVFSAPGAPVLIYPSILHFIRMQQCSRLLRRSLFWTTVLFGLAPALQTIRIDLIPSLKNEPASARLRRWSIARPSGSRPDCVVGDAGHLERIVVRSLQHALSLNLGFNPNGAASVSFDLGLKGYNQERIRQLHADLLAKAAILPGVEFTGIANTLPLRLDGTDGEFMWRAERPLPKPAERRVAMVYNISPGYLRAAGTAAMAGRNIDGSDRAGSCLSPS